MNMQRGMKRSFDEFEDLTVDNGFTRKVKFLMEDEYLTDHPLSSPYAANMVCPSLAILTFHVEHPEEYTVSNVGFVVNCKDGVATIWSQAYGSQSPPNDLTNLKKGKLLVTIQSLEFCGKAFEGTITYIDSNLDILVVKIRTPNSINIPISSLGSFAKFNHLLDKPIAVDLHSGLKSYKIESCAFPIFDEDGSGSCENLHITLNDRFFPGVLFNSDLEVIGLKIRRCNINRQLAHVIRIEDIARSLDLHTYGSDFTDLLAPEKKDGSTSGGDPVVEELQRKVEEANTRIEAVENENAELREQVQSLQSFQARVESFFAQNATVPLRLPHGAHPTL